jgi:hypothetical protein
MPSQPKPQPFAFASLPLANRSADFAVPPARSATPPAPLASPPGASATSPALSAIQSAPSRNGQNRPQPRQCRSRLGEEPPLRRQRFPRLRENHSRLVFTGVRCRVIGISGTQYELLASYLRFYSSELRQRRAIIELYQAHSPSTLNHQPSTCSE